ncbi:MAG: hypothetical protein U0703_29150 [Anaerolineae bacterium]
MDDLNRLTEVATAATPSRRRSSSGDSAATATTTTTPATGLRRASRTMASAQSTIPGSRP